MPEERRLTKQEAIDELRREAEELENKACVSVKEYAQNTYRAKIRRNVAEKLEAEIQEEPTQK